MGGPRQAGSVMFSCRRLDGLDSDHGPPARRANASSPCATGWLTMTRR